ncbi:hypothetical protein, partial [Escherichia marmotae]|uniref:hypothetical protein n=1 Tax=Escherichia marmotae TaxID=1499973 RepID=UPI0028145274
SREVIPGCFANQGRDTDLLWHENEMVGFRPEIRAGKPGKIAVSPAFLCQAGGHALRCIIIHRP